MEGAVDASCVLEQIELQISRVKEEALSRKDILEKVEKWMTACVEESWLEEYNRVGLSCNFLSNILIYKTHKCLNSFFSL